MDSKIEVHKLRITILGAMFAFIFGFNQITNNIGGEEFSTFLGIIEPLSLGIVVLAGLPLIIYLVALGLRFSAYLRLPIEDNKLDLVYDLGIYYLIFFILFIPSMLVAGWVINILGLSGIYSTIFIGLFMTFVSLALNKALLGQFSFYPLPDKKEHKS